MSNPSTPPRSVAVDNNFAIWRAFRNNYWPAHYFIDAKGQIRFHHFGEGEYEKSEQVIPPTKLAAARLARQEENSVCTGWCLDRPRCGLPCRANLVFQPA